MKINHIAFVCCAVSDMSHARDFYEGVLELKLNAPVGPDPYCIEYDVGAGTFAIECNPDWPVSPDGMSVTFEVKDFDAACRHLREHDVAFFLEPTEGLPLGGVSRSGRESPGHSRTKTNCTASEKRALAGRRSCFR
jgi:catechol 2,3-dioxygenase-like lactoylglutathione lyase family enzyme